MKFIALTFLALVAFAANSVLNRAALIDPQISPGQFTAIRLVAGAGMLMILVSLRQGGIKRLAGSGTWISAAMLLLYAVGFSYAYVSLDTGVGALILFGGVQLTMFGGVLMKGEAPGLWRWVGSGLGLSGLAILLLPGASAPSISGSALMLVAAFGWGVYSLNGQGVADPLETTAGNFLRAAPFGAALLLLPSALTASTSGIALAVASGALASGLGYAIWYSVIPRLGASLAAVLQLTVPLIALGGGMVFLGETPTLSFAIAAALILSGVGLAVFGPHLMRGGHKTSE